MGNEIKLSWIQRFILRKVVDEMFKLLSNIFAGNLGWKTLTGALIIMVGSILVWKGIITQQQFDTFLGVGNSIGLVGLRDAFAKLQGK